MTTTCYVVHDRLPHWNAFNDLVIVFVSNFHSMPLVFLVDHKRILLNDSHLHSLPCTQSFISFSQSCFHIFNTTPSFTLIHTQFHRCFIGRRLCYSCNVPSWLWMLSQQFWLFMSCIF